MIDLYFWTTPNGMKPLILLEEMGIEHIVHPVNISNGEQFTAAFTRVSPNQKIPAIVDHAPRDGDAPVTLFESGAILQYLAEKTGQFLPDSAIPVAIAIYLAQVVPNGSVLDLDRPHRRKLQV